MHFALIIDRLFVVRCITTFYATQGQSFFTAFAFQFSASLKINYYHNTTVYKL